MLGNQGTIEQGTKCTSKEQVDQETHRGEYARVERVSRVWDLKGLSYEIDFENVE